MLSHKRDHLSRLMSYLRDKTDSRAHATLDRMGNKRRKDDGMIRGLGKPVAFRISRERFLQALSRKEMDVAELARRIGIHRTHPGRWVHEDIAKRTIPRAHHFIAACLHLEVSPFWLVEIDAEQTFDPRAVAMHFVADLLGRDAAEILRGILEMKLTPKRPPSEH